MKNLTKIIIAIIISAFSLNFLITSTPTYAQTDVCNSEAPREVKDAAGCYGNANQLSGVIVGILNAIIAVSGLVAVVFVLIGGINYITSSGDSNKLEKAKKTILYATIGLVICALSFAIVNWTISAIDDQNTAEETDTDDPIKHTSKSSCENAGYNWDANVKECVQ